MTYPTNAPARRLRAAAAVLALVGASVFGGAVVAASAANPPTITEAPGQAPVGSTITFSGLADTGISDLAVHVRVLDDDTPLCDAAVDTATGTWSCDGTIGAAGTYQVGANTTEGESSPSTDSLPVAIEVYATTISVSSDSSDDNTPTFSGSGPTDGSVEVSAEGVTGTICTVDPIPDTGSWSCTADPAVPAGSYPAYASAIDNAGVTTGAGPAEFSVGNPPDAPQITSPGNNSITGDSFIVVTGNADPSVTTIRVSISGDPDQDCTPQIVYTDPTWTCYFSLSYGDNVITATSYFTDPGNSSFDSIKVSLIPPPTVTYSVGPGSISSTAAPTYPGGTISTEWAQAYDGGEGYNFDEPAVVCSGTAPCTLQAPPGVWSPYTRQYVDEQHSWTTDYFLVPEAPTLAATVNADRTVTVFGTGMTGQNGPVSAPRYDVSVRDAGGQTVCGPATVSPTGFWTCTFSPSEGAHTYRATQVPVDWHPGAAWDGNALPGESALSQSVSVVVPAAPVVALRPSASPTTSPTPTASPKPTPSPTPTWNPETFQWTFTTDADGYHPGDPVTLTGSGLPGAALVEAEIHSTPVHLGTTIARQNGTFIMNVTIPHDTAPGTHEFWVTITPVGGGASTVVQPAKITVVGALSSVKADDGGGGAPGAFGEARNDPGAPSSFTHGITTLSHLVANPVAVAIAGGIGLALLLLVAFPAELLNSTLESQYDRFSRVIPKVRAPWWTRFATWVDKTPLVSASLMTLAASIIFGFADPGFGFDITSFRVVLGCFIALFIVGYLASIISGRILGRAWAFDTVLEVKPLTLILTVVGVVISRLLDFSPGFLIGLLLGMALVGRRTKADEAKSTLVQTGVVFVMALLAWTAYSILSVTTVPDTFGSTLVFDTLVAITTEGMTALFIGLLPVKFLDGQGLFSYSKLLWAGVYALVAFAFVVIVIPAADNWGDGGGSVALWLTIVGAFAALCVGIYLYFRFWAKPIPEDDEGEHEQAPQPAETVNS